MVFRNRGLYAIVGLACILLCASCAKKEKEPAGEAAGTVESESALSPVSDEISFAAFFDNECTERTIEIKGPKQAKLFVVVNFPETLEIAAVEWRLVLPEGVTVETDKPYENRVALLGTFEHGISETFPCAAGPRIILHEFVINVPAGIENGEIGLMPSHEGKKLAIATCDEVPTIINASAYKAVINPAD
jgi:hypothetical protein